jgi:hypothetical protein
MEGARHLVMGWRPVTATAMAAPVGLAAARRPGLTAAGVVSAGPLRGVSPADDGLTVHGCALPVWCR